MNKKEIVYRTVVNSSLTFFLKNNECPFCKEESYVIVERTLEPPEWFKQVDREQLANVHHVANRWHCYQCSDNDFKMFFSPWERDSNKGYFIFIVYKEVLFSFSDNKTMVTFKTCPWVNGKLDTESVDKNTIEFAPIFTMQEFKNKVLEYFNVKIT